MARRRKKSRKKMVKAFGRSFPVNTVPLPLLEKRLKKLDRIVRSRGGKTP